ncbi:hypothetical protein [Magnetospirillum sp. UT-4]|uniref:hypothetical protein n=1 Tax=Magnetospirillum sp. UT-4 TaxID=2681467 RepID=UPI00137D6822|nr:hypothetical protein [Magnetospirillum sp. UT-4]CAA7625749.1 hypothetical protein MTBUT4_70098 [Magnetospirillum sp. UT-4]
MKRCHVCGRGMADHAEGCRILECLPRFERVYHRLVAERRSVFLQHKLLEYLPDLALPRS